MAKEPPKYAHIPSDIDFITGDEDYVPPVKNPQEVMEFMASEEYAQAISNVAELGQSKKKGPAPESVNTTTGEVVIAAPAPSPEAIDTHKDAFKAIQRKGAVTEWEGLESMSVLTAQAIARRLQYLQTVIADVLVKDEDYGVIPGTTKPCLFQPGGQKVMMAFRLRPEFITTTEEHHNFHRTFHTVCNLYHIESGVLISSGVGTCSTLEGRYRFRNVKATTDVRVPKKYWDDKDASGNNQDKYLVEALEAAGITIGADQRVARLKDERNQWMIALTTAGEQQEHNNPPDNWNTCEKMSCKRAMIYSVMNGTGASSVFTQDLEDMS